MNGRGRPTRGGGLIAHAKWLGPVRDSRVGFAVVGLGRLTLGQAPPAIMQCEKAKPVALVSGSLDKARTIAAQYGIAG